MEDRLPLQSPGGTRNSQSPGGTRKPTPSGGRQQTDSKPKLSTGKCSTNGCKNPHLTADKVAELKKVFGNNFQGYYNPAKK